MSEAPQLHRNPFGESLLKRELHQFGARVCTAGKALTSTPDLIADALGEKIRCIHFTSMTDMSVQFDMFVGAVAWFPAP